MLGRAALMADLRRRLPSPGRVLSLVGCGGIGKTRLAAAIAGERDAIFISGGLLRSSDELPPAMALALGLDSDTPAAIGAAIDGRLVVIDQVERVEGIGALLDQWVSELPQVTWLITSRHPLGLRAEVVLAVQPLSTPEPDALQGSDAAKLLANAAPTRLDLVRDADAIAAVLRLTAGIPLAIELAAARLALLSVDDLRARIDARYFSTLQNPSQPGRGLEDVLNDTWSELDPALRTTLAELSVFSAEFRVADAEQVISVGDAAIDHLQRLQMRHLLQATDGWLSLLEPVRRFARDHLGDNERAATAQRYAVWASALAFKLDAVDGSGPERWDLTARRIPEFRAVFMMAERNEATADQGYGCAEAIILAMIMRGSSIQSIAIADRALALADPITDRGIQARGSILILRAQRISSAGLPGAMEGLGEPDSLPHALRPNFFLQLGSNQHRQGRLAEARSTLVKAMDLFGGESGWAWAAADLALVAHDEHQHAEAAELLQRALATCRAQHNRIAEKRVIEVLATIAVEQRDVPSAERWVHAFHAIASEFRDTRKMGLAELYQGTILEIGGRLDEAALAYRSGRELLDSVDAVHLVARADGMLGRIALVQGDVETAAALIPQWADTWSATNNEAAVYGAVLAALTGDVERAERLGDQAPNAPLAAVAKLTASLLNGTSESAFAPNIADAIRHAGDAVVDPIDRRLADQLVHRAMARVAGWILRADGTWARGPDGAEIDLSKSRTNATMLSALIHAHVAGLGSQTWQDLAECVWPGERMVPASARSRVYVALSNLRKAGLDPIIQRDDAGYLLDQAAALCIEP